MKAKKSLEKHKGYYSYPCFVDSHVHIISYGLKLLTHDLEKESLTDLLSTKRDKLIARGWTERPPQKLIDSYNFPIALIRRCGHAAVINKAAMKILGNDSPVLYEKDVERIFKLYDLNDFKKAFEVAQRRLLSFGVSYVHSDDLHGVEYDKLVNIFKNSKIKIYEKLAVENPEEWMFKKVNKRVEIGAIKLFADGSLGARTAYMKNPYRDTGHNGVYLLDDEKVIQIFEFGKRHGVEITVHIIGDAALEKLVNVFESYPGNRIIHAQFVPKDILLRLKRTKFSVQPHFYFEDKDLLRFVKTDSLKYPYLELYKMGYDISFSSDAPVSPADPRYGIEAALMMGFTEEEALKLYTKGSVDTCFYERDDPINDYPVLIIDEYGNEIYSK